jgi:CRP/FNR family transcriptional regulator
VGALEVDCRNCSLYRLCLPVGIDECDLEDLNRIIRRRRPLPRGGLLFVRGHALEAIYAVRAGSIKTYTVAPNGQEQITGFYQAGDLLGLDAIHTATHPCTAKALETSAICEIPFDRFELLASKVPALNRQLLKIMSKELSFDQTMLMLMGNKNSHARLAAFLAYLSDRLAQRGFSGAELHLSMSREDIGNYLGLAMETVSRMFTRFQRDSLLDVEGKHVRILDLEGLRTLAHERGGEAHTATAC